jgi:hypothetical protein
MTPGQALQLLYVSKTETECRTRRSPGACMPRLQVLAIWPWAAGHVAMATRHGVRPHAPVRTQRIAVMNNLAISFRLVS